MQGNRVPITGYPKKRISTQLFSKITFSALTLRLRMNESAIDKRGSIVDALIVDFFTYFPGVLWLICNIHKIFRSHHGPPARPPPPPTERERPHQPQQLCGTTTTGAFRKRNIFRQGTAEIVDMAMPHPA